MRGIGFYRSRRYFQRVLFSIMLSMALILTGLSVVNSYVLETSVKEVQEDSSLKILGQIQYNLSYMSEVILHQSSVAFRNKDMIPLMFTDPLPAMAYIRGYNEMERLMESSSFLHSMAVYNAASGEIYGSSSEFLVDGGITRERIRSWLLQSHAPYPVSRLIPISLGADKSVVDAFAFIVSDSLKPYSGTESALILYVKPDWVFDSLRRMNDAGSGSPGEIYLRMPDGRLLSDRSSGGSYKVDPQAVGALIAPPELDIAASSGFAIGDAGSGKSFVTYAKGIGDWTILYIQPYAPLMKEVTKAREKALLITGIFLLLAMIVSLWLSYQLYGPIDAMLSRIKPHVKEGPLEHARSANELELMSRNVLQLSATLRTITSEQIVSKYYLRKLLAESGSIPASDLKRLLGDYDLNLEEEGEYRACVLRIDNYSLYERSTDEAAKKLYSFALINIAKEIMERCCRCEAVDMQADHAVLILSVKDGRWEMDSLRRALAEIQAAVSRYYTLSVSCGIGEAVSGLARLPSSYRQAYQICLYSISLGHGSIISPDQVQGNMSEARRTLPSQLERKLAEALRKGQQTAAGAELEEAFSLLGSFRYEDMKRAVSDLTWTIKDAAADIMNNRLVPLPVDPEGIPRMIEEDQSLEETYLALLSVCSLICEAQRPAAAERHDLIIGTVKELIRQKYQDPNLSQQSIASSIKLTSAYVGKLFKDRCGISVTEYLNEIRLHQASMRLLQTDRSIAQIMEDCGYSNQSYFFRLFKSRFGSTPKEYRIKQSMS